MHVGVLKGLASLGLRPDLVVGSSVGAPAGTLSAAGLDAERIESLAMSDEDRAPPQAAAHREDDRRKRELTPPDSRLADLLLHPYIGYWAGWSRAYRARLIAAVEDAAVHARPPGRTRRIGPSARPSSRSGRPDRGRRAAGASAARPRRLGGAPTRDDPAHPREALAGRSDRVVAQCVQQLGEPARVAHRR